MNSPLYDIWTKEERAEAAKEARKDSVIELLELNFDLVSKDTREYIESIDDENIIDRLFQKAAKAKSLDEFEEFLDKVKKLD